MKQFMGRGTLPFCSVSFRRSSTGRRTHVSISRIGVSVMSRVHLLGWSVRSQGVSWGISPYDKSRRFRVHRLEFPPLDIERDSEDEVKDDEMVGLGLLV